MQACIRKIALNRVLRADTLQNTNCLTAENMKKICTLVLIALLAGRARIALAEVKTEDVFGKFKKQVIQVRILEKSSGNKAEVGSGFSVGAAGLAVTNYHVVSSLLWQPGDYRAEAVLSDGETRNVSIIMLDIAHDLALIRVSGRPLASFKLAQKLPLKGARLYAIGNPKDLGLTIIEGTYSGVLEESLYEKLHFSGSINPGMSGGPVIDGAGNVVGVCEATEGNQIGFLVPERFISGMMASAGTEIKPEEFAHNISKQLAANQESLINRLSSAPVITDELGPFRVPGRLSPAFRCWAKAGEDKHEPYSTINSECSTDDNIYVKEYLRTGSVSFTHYLLEGKNLDPLRFSSLEQNYSRLAGAHGDYYGAQDEDMTSYECDNSMVTTNGITFKASLCLRGYKKIKGLYDLSWTGASLNESRRALVSGLDVSGVTPENAEKFLKRYLEGFSWKK